MALEDRDELGLPWDEWADGRVRRLAKGRDFLQSAEAVREAAGNAGRRLGKVVASVKESRSGNVFVWVQFVDYQIILGDPCPCGSLDVRRINRLFAECASCGATLVVLEPKTRAGIEEDVLLTPGDLLLHGLVSGDVPSTEASSRRKSRDPRKDLRHLGAFKEIVLFRHARDANTERFYGKGVGPGNRDWLLMVDFPLIDGEWVLSEDFPGGWAHVTWAVPVRPFAEAAVLNGGNGPDWSQPDLQIDDPFVDDYSDRPRATDEGLSAPPDLTPPDSIDDLRDARLARFQSTAEMERFRGVGTLREGDRALVTVRFRLKDGVPIEDPDRPGRHLHDLFCVPVAPFGPLLDLTPLLASEPDLEIDGSPEGTQDAEPVGEFPSR